MECSINYRNYKYYVIMSIYKQMEAHFIFSRRCITCKSSMSTPKKMCFPSSPCLQCSWRVILASAGNRGQQPPWGSSSIPRVRTQKLAGGPFFNQLAINWMRSCGPNLRKVCWHVTPLNTQENPGIIRTMHNHEFQIGHKITTMHATQILPTDTCFRTLLDSLWTSKEMATFHISWQMNKIWVLTIPIRILRRL